MSKPICSYPDCGKSQHGLGYCRGHHAQIKRGKPLTQIIKRPKVCTFHGCNKPHYGRNLCRAHYDQDRRVGTLSQLPERPSTLAERFWSKVDRGSPASCWEWLGSKSRGYGYIGTPAGKNVPAYRLSYNLAYGPILDAMEIDHMCHNPSCVNPAHLRMVTKAENLQNLRGPRVDSTSGVRGVYQHWRSKKWVANASVNGERHHLGEFGTIEEAEDVVIAWRREHMPHSLMDQRNPA